MASTSADQEVQSDSFPSISEWSYDVFLSFRGEDTRHNFTDHLYTNLVRRGITTFRDDQLRRGEDIEQELLNAIQKSRSSIVVFSKTYAHSRWCLDELEKIMKCREEYGQIVLPIFYHVDPSDVRKQTGCYGESFPKYGESWKSKVQRWREVLTEAANISGWHIKEGYESDHIKEITAIIANRILKCELLFIEDDLVGMGSHFKNLSLGLSMESNVVRMIGICGIGGIGKTTIAGYVYNKISWGFECSSFLEKVGEVYKRKGLFRLQNQLLNDILNGENKKISNSRQGAYLIKNSLRLRKALIVFDDVDDMDQLEFLVGTRDWYGKGSRIIITTRDKHLLSTLEVDYLYEVEVLNSNEALKLFGQHAFRSNTPKEDFKDILNHIICYCRGLPLALKVLGSLLYKKTLPQWESELLKLEKEPELKIQNVLKISFDGLDTTQKNVFLDIACFFEGDDSGFASKILDGCKLYGEINIRVLWERCLISISHNRIHMHDLIKKMGWKIVQEQYPEEPSKWSRLWGPNDIYSAFISEKGMKNVETISLDLSICGKNWFTAEIFDQMKKVFANMKKLRLLKVYYSDHYKDCLHREGHKFKMPLPKDFEFPPNLKFLHWDGLESLPLNFHGENLIAINLKSSDIKELLREEKCLAELKFIDLSNSRQFIKIPEFSRMPKLEKLNLEGCISFCKLHSSIDTFSEMKFLKELNFSGSRIREVPSSIGSFISLQTLDLSNCSELEKFPDTTFLNMVSLRRLDLYNSGIKELPSSFEYLESLEYLSLSGCSNFEKFPEIRGNMKCLKTLDLENTAIRELPTSIELLEALEHLSVRDCSNFDKFPEIQKNMENLCQFRLENTAIKELSSSIGHMVQLQFLDLENCKNLRSLPSNICELKSLTQCSLNGCSNLEIFPEIEEDMEYLENLCLSDMLIEELPSSIERLKGLKVFKLNNCENLQNLPDSIGNLRCLRYLLVHNCRKLQKLPESLRSLQCCLEVLDLSGCNLMEGAIPSDLWCLFSLISLDLSENYIHFVPIDIIQLSQLNTLRMNHCPMLQEIPELPSSLRMVEAHGCPCLEILSTSHPRPLIWACLLNCFKSQIQDFVKKTFVGYKGRGHVKVFRETSVIIPGSLPEWIHHKVMGHEIRIVLPKNWYDDDNFLGFAFFFLLVPLDEDNNDNGGGGHNIPAHVQLQISRGAYQFEHVRNILVVQNCRSYPIKGSSSSSSSSSNGTLMVVYFPQIVISSKYRSSGWNNIKACFMGHFKCGKVAFQVKSCGIDLIYNDQTTQEHNRDQSLQLLNVKRGHYESKDYPYHKKLRHV